MLIYINYTGLDHDVLCKACDLVLKSNILHFGNDVYLQKSGTAIGTKMAPSFANIFMHYFESEFLASADLIPDFWKRFIDDIFAIWLHGEAKLVEFIERLNTFNPAIKVTATWSHLSINQLDVNITKGNSGVLQFDVYCKPTDAQMYLDYNSCHPKACKDSLPYSQALRLKRICSEEDTFSNRSSEFKDRFVNRGYPRALVDSQFNRASKMSRRSLLEPPVSRQNNKRTPFVLNYHPSVHRVGRIIHNKFDIFQADNSMSEISRPVVAFRRPRSLKDILVHSNIDICEDSDTSIHLPGTNACGRARCELCTLIEIGDKFVSKVTGENFSINQSFDCNSKDVVYLLACVACGLQYVGSTNNFRYRMNNHRSRLRNPRRNDDVLYTHLRNCGLGFSIRIIDKCDPLDPSKREGFWQYRLKTLKPLGLNMDDMFFSQNKNPRKS